MSVIHCEIDTENKSMIVKVGDKKLKDVESFSVYKTDYPSVGSLSLNISCCTKDEEAGLRTYNSISLAEEGKLVREEVQSAEEIEVSIAKIKLSDADNKKITDAVSGDDISKLIARKVGL